MSKTEKLDTNINFYILELDKNHFHNILRVFRVLPNFGFTASETMCDYYL